MSKSYELDIGGQKINFLESDNQIAIRSKVGQKATLSDQLKSLSDDNMMQLECSLGDFEVVALKSKQRSIDNERELMGRLSAAASQTSVYNTSGDGVPFVPQGTIYLVFNDGIEDSEKQRIIDENSLALVESEADGALTVRTTTPNRDAIAVSAELQSQAIVKLAEPDLITPGELKNFPFPHDALLNRQWHLENLGSHNGRTLGYKAGADARVIAAWQKLDGLGSPNVIVGIIDDGFDLSHPDLAGKAIHPWDFTRNANDVAPEPNLDNQHLGDWHGTACAGVAVAQAGHGKVIGAAPNAQLIPVRWGPDLEPRGVARWFDHMTNSGAWVLSCSWGATAAVYPLPTRISAAITRCAELGRSGKGCVVLFAAGNDNRDIFDRPRSLDGFAVHPDVIAVAASNSRDEKSSYSNYGDQIWVCAPSSGAGGWGIVTSDVRGSYRDASDRIQPMGYSSGDYEFSFGGTSSACPLAAGVCALIFSANPDLSSKQVRGILRDSARKIGARSDYDDTSHSRYFGYGCVDAEKAVEMALDFG